MITAQVKKNLVESLRLEVEVESSLESVKLELARGEEPGGVCGGRDLPQNGKLLRGGDLLGPGGGLGSGGSAESGLVTSQETGLVVGSVKGVDEGVDAGTVSAVGDEVGIQVSGGGTLGGKLGAVDVEGKVAVGGVVGVDEGVEVGVLDLVVVVADLRLRLLLDNLDGLLLLLNLDGLGDLDGGLVDFLSVESGGALTVGGNV